MSPSSDRAARPARSARFLFSVLALCATLGAASLGCGGEPDVSDPGATTAAALTARKKPTPPPVPTPPPAAPTPPPLPYSPPPGASASCPGNDGGCASFGQSRLICTNNGGQYVCTAPAGANVCSNGQICPVGTVCGNGYMCPSEGGSCYLGCYPGGPVTVYDGAVGAACKSVDAHGVTHICASNFCSGGASSVCLPSLPPPSSPINQG
jgi:hypothetical protein